MMVWSLFIIGLMGLFFYNKIDSIIPMVVLPTTEIIEPFIDKVKRGPRPLFRLSKCFDGFDCSLVIWFTIDVVEVFDVSDLVIRI